MTSVISTKFGLTLLAIFLLFPTAGSHHSTRLTSSNPLVAAEPQQSEVELAKQFQNTTQSQWTEWLGPLAPIALSPFFAITCLAAIAQFGGDFLPANPFLQKSAVLTNPAVFWVFLALTLITSIPRLSKISKPAAQAIDLLEAYAGIIIIVVIKFMPTLGGAPGVATIADVGASPIMFQMGVVDFSVDILFAIAAALNILVINTVKFFFEVMVWLIPIPTVDALLEACNKLVCSGLMAIYAYSPSLATMLNLIIFVACLMVFGKINRRVRQMRSLIADPLWSMVSNTYGQYTNQPLVVFNQKLWEGFPAFSKLVLKPVSDGWELHGSKWCLFPRMAKISSRESNLILDEGLIVNSIAVEGAKPIKLTFSRRYRNQTDTLCSQLKLKLSLPEQASSLNRTGDATPEFS